MNKYILKPEHENAQIITKTESGQDILIHKGNFNDYWAERIIQTGGEHLIKVNPQFLLSPESNEKKSFVQISETVISSTLIKDLIEKKPQSETAREPELKRKRGRPFNPKP